MAKEILVALAVMVAMPAPPQAQEIGQPQQVGSAQEVQDAQALDADTQNRRNKVQLMEGLLARAGDIAAESFGRQLQQIEPSMTVALMGQSRARGFMLEGYGIFFFVEVPELRGTVVIAQMMVQRDQEIANALARLKRALRDMPEGSSRQQAQQAISVLDLQAGPAPQERAGPLPDNSARNPAIRVSEGAVEPESAIAPALPAAPAATMAVMMNPRKEYRDTVQRELIDAMLDYSLPLDVAPDEWLAVAARVAEPGQRGQTLTLRVKGSDLAIFAADRDRRDEIRGRVEVRVF